MPSSELFKVFGYSSQNMFMDDPNCYGFENGSSIEGVEMIEEAFEVDPDALILEKNAPDIESLTIKEELIENSSNSTSEKVVNQFEIIGKKENAQEKLPIDPHTINLSSEKEYSVETERRFNDITNDQNDSYCVDRTTVKDENTDENSDDNVNDALEIGSGNESVTISVLLQKVSDIPTAEKIPTRTMESATSRQVEYFPNNHKLFFNNILKAKAIQWNYAQRHI